MEDVVEELIGEEIYDEFDPEGQSCLVSYLSPDAKRFLARKRLVAPARAEVTADLMQRTAVTAPSSPTFKPSGFASSSQGHALTITPRSPSPALSEASVHAVLRSGPGNVTPLRTRSIASTIAGAGRAIAKAGRSRSRHRANTAPEEREAFESHSEKIPEDKTQG
ncbi:hypothetical protein A0H81_12954 [Grifola frondosa]|uniref:Uncharacterized protein n=1 Tax=Grifola frondosa TaxID=5627 RepID=A0A1C7LTL0_GRIFR|nr:hypothetical protein A0H81_12954 [Grifola frondosa]